jgi:tetratricopeptide (TPR) repeat protein
MKSNFNYKIILLPLYILGMLVGFQSCNEKDFFTIDYPPEAPWTKPSEFEFAVASAYKFSLGGEWGAPLGYDRFTYFGSSGAARKIEQYTSSYPTLDVYQREMGGFMNAATSNWNNNYKAIVNINSALSFINQENYPFPTASSEERANVNVIKGELYALRAYDYFALVKRHAPDYTPGGSNDARHIVMHTELSRKLEDSNQPYIATVQEVYDQIINDLLTAKELLPEATSGFYPSFDASHINKFGAAAILAKVYFQMGEYDKALAELNYVIDQNGGRYDLSADPFNAFSYSEGGDNGKEEIWYLACYSVGNGIGPKDVTIFTKAHYNARNGGRGTNWSRIGWHELAMSHTMLKRMGWMDDELTETEEALADKRYNQLYYRFEPYVDGLRAQILAETGSTLGYDTIYEVTAGITVPNVWIDKYYRGTTGDKAGQWSNIPIIRLADMYLLRSASKFKLNDQPGALNDLNAVRTRAGIGDFEGTLTIEDIYTEYIKEMAGEGEEISFRQALELPLLTGDRTGFNPINPPYEGFYWRPSQTEEDLNQNL